MNYWMHNGFLNINSEKMSKSKGNFFTVRDILEEYDAETGADADAVRPLQKPAELQPGNDGAGPRLPGPAVHPPGPPGLPAGKNRTSALSAADEAFIQGTQDSLKHFDDALADDLNSAEAMGALFEMV